VWPTGQQKPGEELVVLPDEGLHPGQADRPGWLLDVPCASGYCHLGGPRISNRDTYGAGW
jgi:hypothetical protein